MRYLVSDERNDEEYCVEAEDLFGCLAKVMGIMKVRITEMGEESDDE